MCTIPFANLPANQPTRVWALEIDLEHGAVQTLGEAEVVACPSDRDGPTLMSVSTGGCYDEPQLVGGVELYNAEDHYLAVFADEASMRAGAQDLIAGFGDRLPVGLYVGLGGARP